MFAIWILDFPLHFVYLFIPSAPGSGRQAAAPSQDEAEESDATEEEATRERTTRVGRPRGGMKVAANEIRFALSKAGFARSATLGLPRKASPVEMGATGAANSHLAGLLMFS